MSFRAEILPVAAFHRRLDALRDRLATRVITRGDGEAPSSADWTSASVRLLIEE